MKTQAQLIKSVLEKNRVELIKDIERYDKPIYVLKQKDTENNISEGLYEISKDKDIFEKIDSLSETEFINLYNSIRENIIILYHKHQEYLKLIATLQENG